MAYGDYRSASELRNVSVPKTIRCDQCEKWKPSDKFSNKQLNDYRRGKRKIRCMGCTIDQRSEMTCEGPCSETKALDKFSKNSRSAHGNHWCEECTNWKATPGYNLVTGPAPGQALTPDEVLRRGPVQETNESLYEGDDDDDRTDIASIATNGTSTAAWYNANPASSATPLLTNYDASTSVVEGMGSLSMNSRGNNGYVLPHLRHTVGSAQPAMSTTSSTSNPYRAEPVPRGVAVWTDVDEEPEPARHFNAWDSRGNQHVQTRAPSVTTPSVAGPSARGSGATGATQGGNAWRPVARPATTRVPAPPPAPVTQAPQLPSYGIEGDSDSDDYGYYGY